MRRRLRQLLWVVAAAAAITGCGSTSDRPLRITLAALATKPAAASPSSPAQPQPRCSHLTASLRAPAVMPTPGAMPKGSFMKRIQRRHYLLAGVDQNTFLFGYFNPEHGRSEGFEIDLLRQIAKAIFGSPRAIQFRAVTPAQRIAAVQSGSVDIVADAVTITCERRQQVDFSTVYFDAGQKVLVPSNSTARSVKDLGGKRVCAAVGSTTIATLMTLTPRPIPYGVPQRTDCLVALQQGLVDAISSDDSILLGFEAQDPNTKIVGGQIAAEPYGMAISKAHPEFVRFVNGVLARMRADGSWRRLYAHWLGKATDAKTPAPPTAQYVR
ncbi:MAG TPA: glutamate ABC transporter substrate-binding protein [Solirubrobacteraceae bacterium]|nr:glutamate ABC transporter substrate-binding protein [Solirubrobacteraceae bacterium]